MGNVDPAFGVVVLAHSVVIAVILGQLQTQGVELLHAQILRLKRRPLKGGKGGLLHIGFQTVQQIDLQEVVHLLVQVQLPHGLQGQILHGLGEALSQVHGPVGIEADKTLHIVAEFMGHRQDVLAVAAGADEEIGRLVIAQIGLEAHVRLVGADAQIVQLVLLHEGICLRGLVPHGRGDGLQHVLQILLLHQTVPDVVPHALLFYPLIERHQRLPHTVDKAVALLHGEIPAVAQLKLHIRVAVKAEAFCLLLPQLNQLDIELTQDRIVFLIKGVVAPGDLLVGFGVIRPVAQEPLLPVDLNHGVVGQTAVLRDQLALPGGEGHVLIRQQALALRAVLLQKALPEVVLFQTLGIARRAAGQVHPLHDLADLRLGGGIPGVLLRVVLVRQILAVSDIRDGGHGIRRVVQGKELVQKPGHLAKTRRLFQRLPDLGSLGPHGVQIRPLVGHVRKAAERPDSVILPLLGEQPRQAAGHARAAAQKADAQKQGEQGQGFLFHRVSPNLFFLILTHSFVREKPCFT